MKICTQCNILFKVRPCREKSAKFCSVKCRALFKSCKIKKICETCQTEFEVSPSLDRIRFCSHKCKRVSHEVKEKIRKTLTGRTRPQNVRDKIGKTQKGRIAWNKGKGGYKRPEHSEWLKKNGHWKMGQTFGERFGGNAEKIRNNLSKFRKSLAKPKDPKKRDYYLNIWKITRKQPLQLLKNYEKRGRAKKGTDNYQVDHIIPIIEGYKKNITPNIIGNIANLRMLHWKENIKRNRK